MATETTFSKRIGEDHYEVRRTTFQVVKRQGGFDRLATRERHYYYFNGKQIFRRVWFVLKAEALLTDQERAERDAKKGRIAALLTELSGGRL